MPVGRQKPRASEINELRLAAGLTPYIVSQAAVLSKIGKIWMLIYSRDDLWVAGGAHVGFWPYKTCGLGSQSGSTTCGGGAH